VTSIIEFVICVIIGYLLGSLSPAALISKLKNKDLRTHGTGNLGATNTLLTFGKGYGALVMFLDIAKAFLVAKLAELLFPKFLLAGLAAGGGAVVGHVFPFYMKFKGGKGLAAFGGMILAFDSVIFAILLIIGIVLMLIVNYSFALPMSAAILFPIFAGVHSKSLTVFMLSLAVSLLIIVKHSENVLKARNESDIKIREYIKDNLFVKKG